MRRLSNLSMTIVPCMCHLTATLVQYLCVFLFWFYDGVDFKETDESNAHAGLNFVPLVVVS